MWGKKNRRSPWYSPSSYVPSHRTRQKYNKLIRHSMSKNLAVASKNAPTIAALLLGMLCILLAKKIAHKLHISRLRWQYNYSRQTRYVSETLLSPFKSSRKKKKKKNSSRRKSYLKYSQDYQKAEEDKIIPYNDVLGVFAQCKTPPPRKMIHHQKHKVTPEDKENSENGTARERRGGKGRRTLQVMQ